jgi:hypothetical protein
MERDLTFDFNPGTVNPDAALIYLWEIKDAANTIQGVYVGKAKSGGERPLNHYKRNVKRLLAGLPYRKSNPDGYRKSHQKLAEAVTKGYSVSLSFVCNVGPGESIDAVEQRTIRQYNSSGDADWQLNA